MDSLVIRRTVAGASLLAAATVGASTAATTTAAASGAARPAGHGSTGTIRVTVIHNYGADHAKGRRICALATTKKHDHILGKCDIADKNGVAVLKHVPAGVCNVGAYDGHLEPYARAKHQIHVHAGKTTKYTWHFNEVTTS